MFPRTLHAQLIGRRQELGCDAGRDPQEVSLGSSPASVATYVSRGANSSALSTNFVNQGQKQSLKDSALRS